jgi:hypothetical protein
MCHDDILKSINRYPGFPIAYLSISYKNPINNIWGIDVNTNNVLSYKGALFDCRKRGLSATVQSGVSQLNNWLSTLGAGKSASTVASPQSSIVSTAGNTLQISASVVAALETMWPLLALRSSSNDRKAR